MNEKSFLILENRKHKKYVNLIIFTPECRMDTFMSCISYWIYGTTANRKLLRKEILLFFAEKCFINQKFKSIQDVVNLYFQNKLVFNHENPYVKTAKEAFNFISTNSDQRIVSSIETMIAITSKYLKICIFLDMGRNKRVKIFGDEKCKISIWLYYNSQNKTCKIKHWKGLTFVKRKTMYELRVSKQKGEMVPVCDFKRKDSIHTCKIYEFENEWIFTVFPTNGYKQFQTPCFIYLQAQDTDEATCVASTSDSNMNPYFYIESDAETVLIHIVQADTNETADTLLQFKHKHKNKITIL